MGLPYAGAVGVGQAFQPDVSDEVRLESLTYGQAWRLAAEFSLVIIGMLLFSERTWKHHCVTLLLPFAVLAYYLASVPAGTSAPWLSNRQPGCCAGAHDLHEHHRRLGAVDEVAKQAQVYGDVRLGLPRTGGCSRGHFASERGSSPRIGTGGKSEPPRLCGVFKGQYVLPPRRAGRSRGASCSL